MDEVIKLDRIDKHILRLMQNNARISNLELAETVGLSPTPCSRRVKRLEESGIIDKHVTLLKPSVLGLNLTAMISISMDRHTPDRFDRFQAIHYCDARSIRVFNCNGSKCRFFIKSGGKRHAPL